MLISQKLIMPLPKKKTLKVKKLIQPKSPVKKTNQPTKIELKRAYNLVTTDLFNQLVKLKEGTLQIGTLGSLGSFKKTERKIRSAIVPKGSKLKGKPKLNTYVYYSVRFRPSKRLKEKLNEALVRKYR
jgi:nucleoid DNA-binding protein